MRGNKQERIIYLLRHGRILPEGSERRYIGQTDVPLSSEGVRQACLLQTEFGGKDISSVFCSDLIRSIDTAKIICESLTKKMVIRADLREIRMGDWEGKTFREIAQCYPEEHAKRGANIASYRIPGAESFGECQSRIIAAFSDIIDATEKDVIIVGHAGVNRVLLCHVLGMPIDNLFRISQDYECINILAGGRGQYRVKLLNGFRVTEQGTH